MTALTTEALPALHRHISLEVWTNTGQSGSQTLPGLSMAHCRLLAQFIITAQAILALHRAAKCQWLCLAIVTP